MSASPRTRTVDAHGGGELYINAGTVEVGEAFCSARIVGQNGVVDGDRIGDHVAFDPDTMAEVR